MTTEGSGLNLEVSRRRLIAAAGIGGGIATATFLIGPSAGEAASLSHGSAHSVATPPISGLHLQFGADASSEIVVSWHTLHPVRNARVMLGRLDGKLEQTAQAKAVSYTDGKSRQVVYAYHAKIGGLRADTS